MIQLETLSTGEGDQFASSSVDDEMIIVVEDPNFMSTDGDEHNVPSKEISLKVRALAHNIEGKLHSAPPSDYVGNHSIFRIHEGIRKINEFAYAPELVSIGPFHRGEGRLKEMEKCKLIYMRDMLTRATGGYCWSALLEECVGCIEVIEEKARRCYSEPINLSSEEFVEMLVVDGLFILELFLRVSHRVLPCGRHDPVRGNYNTYSSLSRDVVLLENQIPMFVIDNLSKWPALCKEMDGFSINMLGLYFLSGIISEKVYDHLQCSNYEACHLLDLFAQSLYLSFPGSTLQSLDSIPTATELKNAGVNFKKGSATRTFLDIKFGGGVLEIPPLDVEDITESVLRNLIAYEQYSSGDVYYFTSYAVFMDSLINSGSDVKLLRKKGIIRNCLGSDEFVSNLFNNLCTGIVLKKSHYVELEEEIKTYYKKRRHTWRATLIRDYFNSPWATISVAAAILLIGLTLTQTIFAVLSA